MAAISNKLSDAEESMNKLLNERSEYILTNMEKLNKEQKSGIDTNSNNHKALLQGETPSIFNIEFKPCTQVLSMSNGTIYFNHEKYPSYLPF